MNPVVVGQHRFYCMLVRVFWEKNLAIPSFDETERIELFCRVSAQDYDEYLDPVTLLDRVHAYAVQHKYCPQGKSYSYSYGFHHSEGLKETLPRDVPQAVLDNLLDAFVVGYVDGFHGNAEQGRALFMSWLSV